VATFLGTLIALSWPVGLAACGTWLVAALVTRISSVAALTAAATSSLWLFWFGEGRMLLLVVLLTILVYIRHAENLKRIKAGTEPKIGQKKPSDTGAAT
jgi:glycerol-3-phosphate acyltransferase PlsY